MKTEQINQHLVGKTYNEIVPHLKFTEDNGDCCGFADYEETSVIPEGVDLNKLTLRDCILIDYGDNYGSRSVVNFVFTDGEGDLILGYELRAGSGSGWSYGAYVQIRLHGEVLAEESW